MSLAKDPTLRELNDCNCCTGIGARTPVEVENRPGLNAIVYRIGTHSLFKGSMLARLSARKFPGLQDLRTRDDDDFTIALLDAWASVADVLTFYQERIANESYLRTATEEAKGAPSVTEIPIGTRVQSIPGPGEKPQVFETIAPIDGRPEWNVMKPRLAMEQELSVEMKFALFQGVTANLKVGDSLLIVKDSSSEVMRVVKVFVDQERKTTRINFVTEEIPTPPFLFKAIEVKGNFFTTPMKLTGSLVKKQIFSASWPKAQLFALAKVQKWPVKALTKNLIVQAKKKTIAPNEGIFALRQKAAIFGHNAPNWGGLDSTARGTHSSTWEGRTLRQESPVNHFIYLDRVYEGILPKSWVVLKGLGLSKVFQVVSVSEVSRADFTLSAKVTRLELDRSDGFDTFTLRDTSVYLAESEPLELADLPITDDIPRPNKPNEIILAEPHLELEVGQKVILTGERTDLEGVGESELLEIGDIEIAAGYTRLTFTKDIQNTYQRDSVTLNANVALATHGEKAEEVLGSGDSRVEFQKFKLRQPPLTYVPASNPSGAQSTLEVRVDELKWQEVDTLHGRGPSDKVYVLSTDAEGQSTVQFGDGHTGARVPTGTENIQATYRKGMGEEGLVDSGQLKLLLTRPLGVREVDNPLAADGAEDREARDQVRRNAPLPIMTLDRIVSLQDYEDFARAFAGIAKAMATWTWDGGRRGVFVTVAGSKGGAVGEESATFQNLVAAMQKAGDPLVPLRVQTYVPAFFRVEALVKIHPDYQAETVLKAVEEALRKQYAFEIREFGQDVTRAEVITTIQRVPGVVAVDLDFFFRTDANEPTSESRLTASIPKAGLENPLAAELLTLDPRPVPLGVMS
jgi:hypothetical protein